jgi:hypothetical protein
MGVDSEHPAFGSSCFSIKNCESIIKARDPLKLEMTTIVMFITGKQIEGSGK